MENIKILASLAEAIGLMALISVAFGVIERTQLPRWQRSVLFGLLFGCGAIVAMLTPTQLGSGGQIDGRSIIVGLGAAFGGIPAAIIAAAIAGGFRFFVVGGYGALPGTVGIVLAAILGLIWIAICRCNGRPQPRHLAIAGGMISLQFSAVYVLPLDVANGMVMRLYPLMLAASVAGALVLGALVQRERRLFEVNNKWQHEAKMDPLTGLLNRRAIEREFARLSDGSRDNHSQSAVVLFDIDHFKQVNDKHGHAAGDDALVAFAQTLQQNTRAGDIVARMGGEEFCVLMPDTSRDDALIVADRVLSAVRAALIELPDATVSLTVSGGAAFFHSEKADFATLLSSADKALYQAKSSGRDRVVDAGFAAAA